MYDTSKPTWLNPNIEYLFDNEIIEYDMKDAGFSLIKEYNLLPQSMIKSLEMINKGKERHIAVGKIQGRDKVFSKALSDKFAEMRYNFISANNISDNDIISVKKDAIFTIGRCTKLTFGLVQFSEKNQYSSYIRFPDIRDLEIYYSSNNIDIKGMADNIINRHRLYMYNFIITIIGLIESHNTRAKRYINKFIDQYKNHELDDEYYVEFNNVSREINPYFNFQKIIVPFVQIITKEMR